MLRGTAEVELFGALVMIQDFLIGLGENVPILARYICNEQVIVLNVNLFKILS